MTPAYPQWDAAFAAWEAGRRAELAFDSEVLDPARAAGIDTPEMWEESDRMTDLRADGEDAVLAVPALNAEQLAVKILIAMDNGRAADFFYASIFRDCRRFASDELTRGAHSEGLDPQPFDPAGCRALLDERNAALIAAKLATDDAAHSVALDISIAAHNAIFERSATSGDDVIAKLIALAQEAAEGASPAVADCAQAIREAKAFFGMGWVDPNISPTTEAANG